MISDEGQRHAAQRIEAAAERAQDAANRMEQAAQRIAFLLEDGYGGNGLKLIELLEKTMTKRIFHARDFHPMGGRTGGVALCDGSLMNTWDDEKCNCGKCLKLLRIKNRKTLKP